MRRRGEEMRQEQGKNISMKRGVGERKKEEIHIEKEGKERRPKNKINNHPVIMHTLPTSSSACPRNGSLCSCFIPCEMGTWQNHTHIHTQNQPLYTYCQLFQCLH